MMISVTVSKGKAGMAVQSVFFGKVGCRSVCNAELSPIQWITALASVDTQLLPRRFISVLLVYVAASRCQPLPSMLSSVCLCVAVSASAWRISAKVARIINIRLQLCKRTWSSQHSMLTVCRLLPDMWQTTPTCATTGWQPVVAHVGPAYNYVPVWCIDVKNIDLQIKKNIKNMFFSLL